MPKRAHYFDRFGREVAEHEAMRGGTLRDHFSMRVPTVFRDSRFTARQFWDSGQLVVTDARRIGGSEGNKPGFRLLDNNLGRQAIADAHAAYVKDLESAWRNPPGLGDAAPPPDPEEDEGGDEEDEDDDGRPQGKRVRPVTADHRSLDQIAHDHSVAMERLYAARNREISEAWREGKATNG